MKNFRDKVVAITGAGSGIGRAYALEFARLGAYVALNDCDAEALEATRALVTEIRAGAVYTEAFDVADKDAMYRFAAHVQRALGNTHVIINNAGVEGAAKPVYLLDDAM